MLRRRLLIEWSAIALLTITIVVGLLLSHATKRLDAAFYDLIIGLRAPPPSDRIIIVAIDDASLATVGQWPWPRSVHAQAVRQIARAGPSVLVYDVLFTEPGRSPEDDAALGEALSGVPAVLPSLVEIPGRDGRSMNVTPPVETIARGARRIGHVVMPYSEDGSGRAALLKLQYGDAELPHAMEWAHRLAQGHDSPAYARGERVGLVPFLPESGAFRTVPFDALRRGELPSTFLHGKIVLVGATAGGLGDRHTVPVRNGGTLPGVEVQANLLNALLADRLVQEASTLGQIAYSLLSPLLLLIAFWFLRPNSALSASLVALVLAFALPVPLLIWCGLWMPPACALIGLLIAYPLWGWRRLQAADAAINAELGILASETLVESADTRVHLLSDPIGWQTAQLSASIARLRDLRRLIGDAIEGVADPLIVTTMTDQIIVANTQATNLFGADLGGGDLSALLSSHLEAGSDAHELNLGGRIFSPRRTPLSNDRGEQRGWILLLAEITAIREAMREREDAIEFLSHDIRSPQASTITLVQGLHESIPAHISKPILANARRTLEMADGFVQLARLGHRPFTPEPTDVCDSIGEAMDELWPQSKEQNIRIVGLNLQHPCCVLGERDTLTRLFVNLIGNAIKFNEAGGEVRCGARVSSDGLNVIAYVVDDGPGIPADRLTHLFQRFGPVTPRRQGSGLGLAYVREAAERHGGQIAFTSVSPRGARFELTLPAVLEM